MHWQDEAIILNIRRHGEHHAIAALFARGQGRWHGMAHGATSRGKRAWLQPGNIVEAQWRARTAEQLGNWALEPSAQPAAVALGDSRALAALQAITAALALCPERAPYPALFDGARLVLERLEEPGIFPALLARFELALLAGLGYGLDLSRCALTGESEDLAWVSPKTGRAATRAAGAPWAEKLLPLPAFLLDGNAAPPTPHEVADALRLTAHFLRQRLFEPQNRQLPTLRLKLPEMLEKAD